MKMMFAGAAAAIEVAEAAYKMWKGLQEERRQRRTVQMIKEINIKLDIVIRKQDEILAELKAMRVYFRDELRRQFLSEVEIGMMSHRSALAVIVSLIDVDRGAAFERVRELEHPTRTFSFNLLQRGSAAFTASFSAAVLHLSVLSLLRELGARVRVIDSLELAFLDEWESHFLKWFHPDTADGLAYPLRLLRQEREGLQSEIENFPRRIAYGSTNTGRYHTSGRKHCQIHRQRTLVITGDLSSGFSDYLEEGGDFVSGVCEFDRPDRHGPSAGATPDALFAGYDFTDPMSLIPS